MSRFSTTSLMPAEEYNTSDATTDTDSEMDVDNSTVIRNNNTATRAYNRANNRRRPATATTSSVIATTTNATSGRRRLSARNRRRGGVVTAIVGSGSTSMQTSAHSIQTGTAVAAMQNHHVPATAAPLIVIGNNNNTISMHGPGGGVNYRGTDYGQNLLDQLKQLNKKFRLSCNQVVLLNNEIEYMQNRYDRAVSEKRRSFRYFLRLQIATLEGVRNMFYEYACRKADTLDSMHQNLLNQGVIQEELNLSDLDNDEP